MPVDGKLKTSAQCCGTALWSGSLNSLEVQTYRKSAVLGGHGSWAPQDGCHRWMERYPIEKPDGHTQGTAFTERCGLGWHPQRQGHDSFCQEVASPVVGRRLGTAEGAAEDSVGLVSLRIPAPVASSRSLDCEHGSSSPAWNGKSFMLVWLMMFGMWGDHKPTSSGSHARPVCCAGEGNPYLPVEQSQPPSSSPSRNPPMTAANALEVVAARRVAAWRQAHHMENEEDFAWAFTTQEAAVMEGGHCLAEAWIAARARQEDRVLPVVVEMAEDLRPRPSQAPAATIRAKPKAWGKSKRQPLRLRENTHDTPEAIQRRVFALTQVFLTLGALRPEGLLTSRLHREWEQSCQRLSQQLVTSAEAVTVTNAVRTATELNAFMEERGRKGTPCHVDLDAYLHTPAATSAPCRALASLRWLCRQGQMSWDLSALTAPTARSRHPNKEQALVVVPPMWPFLEERVEQLWRVNDEQWTCLLAAWIIGAGCLRYKHVQRATLRKLSRSTLHCKCPKGKQSRTRTGFAFCLPSTFSTGFPWAEKVLEMWDKLPPGARTTCGLCFDKKGQPWPLQAVNTTMREIFTEAVDSPELLSSYSWRRMPSTAAHTMKLSPLDMAALGDWVNKKDLPEESRMPLHYSGARYGQSMRAKHFVLHALADLTPFETWELIPQTAIEAHRKGKLAADRAVQQDDTVLWALPIEPHEVKERFELTTAMRSRTQKRKAETIAPSVEGAMPDEIQGKVITAFMKNGAPLCSSFQTRSCIHQAEDCTKLHKCAVVLRTGRACGGSHAAYDCFDKRAVQAASEAASPGVTLKAARRSGEGDSPGPRAAQEPAAAPKPAAKPRPKGPTPRSENPTASGSRPPQLPAPPPEDHEAHFDQLATYGKKTPEKPTLIYSNPQGGQLWLSGLPRQETLSQFPETTLQLVCFAQEVEQKGGVKLPGALLLRICPASKRDREGQWQISWPTIRNTLQAGETAVVHCMATP